MTEEARKARAAYKSQWAKEHPELVRAQQERYWEKKAKAAKTAKIEPAEQVQDGAAEVH